jgi:Ca-activated chloride channel family protein
VFAETPEDAPGIFAEEFEGLASLVAQNVSVEIRPTADVELVGVLNEYPTVVVPDGVQLQLGDAYGSERRRLVFELHVPQLAALGPARVADVVLRYVAVGAETAAHEVTVPVVVNLVSADEAAAAEIDTDVTEEVTLLQAARARREAIRRYDRDDVDGSAAGLMTAAGDLRARSASAARGGEFLAEAELLETHAQRLHARDKMSRKRLYQEQWRRNRGRPV